MDREWGHVTIRMCGYLPFGAQLILNGFRHSGESRFRVSNKWVRGGHNQSRVSGFYSGGQEQARMQTFMVDADEPEVLAGTDVGANPVEYLLSALAACITTSVVYHAAVRGIESRALEAALEGPLDLQGLLGMSDEVRQGFEGIRVRDRIDTDEENVALLQDFHASGKTVVAATHDPAIRALATDTVRLRSGHLEA